MSTTSSATPEPKYIAWNQVEREHLNPLVDREMVYGQQLMLARVFLKKDGHVPLHHHHNEQLTYILEGALKFAINGKEIVVGPGSVLFFASMQPHAVQNIGDARATCFASDSHAFHQASIRQALGPERDRWARKRAHSD